MKLLKFRGKFFPELLFRAIMDNNAKLVKNILEENFRISSRTFKNRTLLHIRDECGRTHLHVAAENCEDPRIVKLLLRYGAKINATTPEYENVLQIAILNFRVKSVKCLINEGAKLDLGKISPLHLACFTGSTSIVRWLLEAGANVNRRDYKSATPLHNACAFRHAKIVNLLLKYGADVNAATSDVDTPLHWALITSDFDDSLKKIVKSLLQKNCDINVHINGHSAFNLVLRSGDVELVNMFLKHGADIYKKNFFGNSSLHYAALNANPEVLHLILKSYRNINETCSRGNTALHHAAKECLTKNVQMLLYYGVDVNLKNSAGYCPLYTMLMEPFYRYDEIKIEQRDECIRLLLNEGIYVNNFINGKTILKTIIERNDTHAMHTILQEIAKRDYKLNDYNINLISNYDVIKDYYDLCRTEIKIMKEQYIYEKVTVFDVLIKSIDNVARYTSNTEFLENFQENFHNCYSKYLIFGKFLRKKFDKSVKVQELKEQAIDSLSLLLRITTLPILENIWKHLYKYQMNQLF